jgi:hypothetical protein
MQGAESPPRDDSLAFNRVRDAGEVVSVAVLYLRIHFRSLGIVLLTTAVPVAILGSLVEAFGRISRLGGLGAIPMDSPLGVLFSTYGTLSAGILISTVVVAIIYCITYAHIDQVRHSRSLEPVAVRARALQLAGPVIIVTLAIYGFLLVSLLLHVLICIGSLIWVGLMVMALPYAFLIYPARLYEDDSIRSAFRLTRDITKPNLGLALGSAFLALVIMIAVAFAFMVPLEIVDLIATLQDPTESLSPLWHLGMIVGALIGSLGSLVSAFGATFAAYLFYSLLEMEEAPELRASLERLRAQGPT